MWADRKPLQRGEHPGNCLFFMSEAESPSRVPWNPCSVWLVSDGGLPFRGNQKSWKIFLQPLRANRSTMGICIFIDKQSTRQATFGERKEGVNRHSTEIVAKKMWRRSSHVLRPKKVAEDSNCWRPAILAIQRRSFQNWRRSWSRSRKKKLWVQEIRAWVVWETLKSSRFPMLWKCLPG